MQEVTRVNLPKWSIFCACCLFWTMAVIPLSAQTLTTLVSFNGTDGYEPLAQIIQGFDGNLYGTTLQGGVNTVDNAGTVFRLTPGGTLTQVYDFCAVLNCTDGGFPWGGVVQATDGNFYGTTVGGGNMSYGVAFKLTPAGAYTRLFSFNFIANAQGALIQGSDHNLYGTTAQGGSGGGGTVFKVTPKGPTVLYNFCSMTNCSDGSRPFAGLVEGTDGYYYGTTEAGGKGCFSVGCGTIFRISSAGKLTTLYRFCSAPNCPDGESPSGLVQGSDGNLYGTTVVGGATNNGVAFKISPTGKMTMLHSFCMQGYPSCIDGSAPNPLVQGSDGNFYGTTQLGGSAACNNGYGCGILFQLTPGGSFAPLYAFCSQTDCADGSGPSTALMQDTDGNFYGSTEGGGNPTCNAPYGGCGTIFKLSMGLGPFVKLVRQSGKVGQKAGILGQGFSGSTSVAVNGTSANFEIVSDTLIRATIPAGATSGYVTVTTPTGTLSSNVVFNVRP